MHASAADHTIDLSFKPVETTSPKVLSPAGIAQFNREGYVRPFTVFSANEVMPRSTT